jgi:uncharacterized phage protein (TIGR01671 family)
MREIKFRAWDKKRKRMYEVHTLILNSYHKEINPHVWANLWGFDIIEDKDILLHAEDVELVQYTGLKDKNGKEIYEGDIVKYGSTPYTVSWIPEICAFEITGYNRSIVLNKSTEHIMEVIGNIIENSELVEE